MNLRLTEVFFMSCKHDNYNIWKNWHRCILIQSLGYLKSSQESHLFTGVGACHHNYTGTIFICIITIIIISAEPQ